MSEVSNYNPNNVFSKIIKGELPSTKVYEDKNILAFHDISKVAPVHILVIPKEEFIDYNDFISRATDKQIVTFFKSIKKVAQIAGLKEYRLINNTGSTVSQTVFHLHFHIIGGTQLGALLP